MIEPKKTPTALIKYAFDNLPKDAKPTFFALKNKCYPLKAVSDTTLECIEELVSEMIKTSEKPESLLKRIALLKEHPKTKEMIWKEAFLRVMNRIESRTEEEIKKEFGENYLIIDLDSKKKDYKIQS